MPAAAYPDSSVFYRKLDRTYPKIVRGEGCWLFDDSGKKYLDAVGGAFVANLGHGVREIAHAMAEQASKVAYLNGTAFTHEPAEALAREVVSICPDGLDKAYFLGSGSEAVEAALKLSRQYWVESGKPKKAKIIARSPGYHGNTLLALSASARGHYKRLFRPWLVDVRMIPAPYAYRCPCGGKPPLCPACSGQALEEAILEEGPETVAAFIAEPVGGSSTGASVPGPDYYRTIREICGRHQVLFVADEVLTGMGRTGTWLAMEPYGVSPDLLVLGKGLSGGYAPLSALVAPRRILDVLKRGSGGLLHAQTFSHHPVSCAAGLAAIRMLKERKLVEKCAQRGKLLQENLKVLLEHPNVGDVRGKGLLAGVEIVKDKQTKAPFPRKEKAAERLAQNALEAGLVLWPNVGHADGENGDLVMVAPPFVVAEEELEEIVRRLKGAIERTFASKAGGAPTVPGGRNKRSLK